jgi:hypothetical protein
MNLVDGLGRVRAMLEANGAEPATLGAVDAVVANAESTRGGSTATAPSLLQITRMLLKTPLASGNVRIYNDLTRLEEQLATRADAAAREREVLDARPMPKSKKFYKEQREREERTKGRG